MLVEGGLPMTERLIAWMTQQPTNASTTRSDARAATMIVVHEQGDSIASSRRGYAAAQSAAAALGLNESVEALRGQSVLAKAVGSVLALCCLWIPAPPEPTEVVTAVPASMLVSVAPCSTAVEVDERAVPPASVAALRGDGHRALALSLHDRHDTRYPNSG